METSTVLLFVGAVGWLILFVIICNACIDKYYESKKQKEYAHHKALNQELVLEKILDIVSSFEEKARAIDSTNDVLIKKIDELTRQTFFKKISNRRA